MSSSDKIGYSALLWTIFCSASLAGGELDKSRIYADSMPKYSAIHVHLFSTTDADPGNPKFRDTAKAKANSAPHLLAADIVNKLQESGFIEVSRNETEGDHSAET